MTSDPAIALRAEIAACRVCAAHLAAGPRPIVQLSATAQILIIGQAPGAKVHASGTPWQDDSGDRLRAWVGLDAADFYDPAKVALMPMGFCYPGKGSGGDLPPRPECAPLWHARPGKGADCGPSEAIGGVPRKPASAVAIAIAEGVENQTV